MALHKPEQFLDFIYKRNQEKVYLRIKATVELNINEYIPPVPVKGRNPDFTIDLFVSEDQNDDRVGWYSYPVTYEEHLFDHLLSENAELTDDQVIVFVRKRLEKEMGPAEADNHREYTVTTRVIKAGVTDGEVKNTISSNGDIVLD